MLKAVPYDIKVINANLLKLPCLERKYKKKIYYKNAANKFTFFYISDGGNISQFTNRETQVWTDYDTKLP